MMAHGPGSSPMTDAPSIHDLQHARYMALDHKPASDSARNLCHMLAAALAQADTKRKNRRGEEKQREFEEAVGAVLVDLLLAHADDGDGWCYRSSHAADFNGEAVTYRSFMPIMTTAVELQLVDHLPGFYEAVNDRDATTGKVDQFRLRGMAGRYRATTTLVGFA